MPPEPARIALPDDWGLFLLPPVFAEHVDALVARCLELRIPAAISAPLTAGSHVLLRVPVGDTGRVLALTDEAGPDLSFVETGPGQFPGHLRSIVPGCALDELDPFAEPAVHAVAWTAPADTAAMRFGATQRSITLATATAEDGRSVVFPTGDPAACFSSGIWGGADLTLTRFEDHLVARTTFRRRPLVFAWTPGWRLVDPSRPDQLLITEQTVADELDHLIGEWSSPQEWADRFRLDPSRSERLRILMRLPSRSSTAHELADILGLPAELALAVAPGASVLDLPNVLVLHPAKARDVLSEAWLAAPSSRLETRLQELSERLERADARSSWTRFGESRPRLRFALMLCLAAASAALSISGFVAGRGTAFLPAVAACFWTVLAGVDLATLRTRIRGLGPAAGPGVDPESDGR
jgi:hypothetical protein